MNMDYRADQYLRFGKSEGPCKIRSLGNRQILFLSELSFKSKKLLSVEWCPLLARLFLSPQLHHLLIIAAS